MLKFTSLVNRPLELQYFIFVLSKKEEKKSNKMHIKVPRRYQPLALSPFALSVELSRVCRPAVCISFYHSEAKFSEKGGMVLFVVFCFFFTTHRFVHKTIQKFSIHHQAFYTKLYAFHLGLAYSKPVS